MGSSEGAYAVIVGTVLGALVGIGAWTWWKTRHVALALARQESAVLTELRNHYLQLEALVALYHDLRPASALPPTRGMAASPDFLRIVFELIRDRQPQRILELGSGASTVIVATTLARNGRGHVWSVDHEAGYAEATRQALTQRQLADWVTVVHAPLTALHLDGQTYSWYDLAVIPEHHFDMIVVDGPPQWVCRDARYPTVPVLAERLAPDGIIIADDADRADETEAIKRWLGRDHTLTLSRRPAEKGCALIVRSRAGEHRP